jgi:hypothetical protein
MTTEILLNADIESYAARRAGEEPETERGE